MAVTDVNVRRVDEFDLGRVSLVKIDVEGYEAAVLEPGRGVIESDRPRVIVEVTPSNRMAIARRFEATGDSVSVVARNRLVPLPDGIERYDGPKYNFVFLPTPARGRAHAAMWRREGARG
ncbi:MAG: FkbM family methyltransferase [Acidobacteria bacterium]|nr:FkbM family methyltransferase [Acidobacteriota bacterium]